MTAYPTVGAVILAAGESRRFGSPKQLAMLGDRTLLEHVLESARLAGLAPIATVVPGWLPRPATVADPALRWVSNAHPERGMSHSLRIGFDALPAETDAAVILLGDQPTVSVEHLRALIGTRGDRPIVATRANERIGPPILVERSQFPLVKELVGDIGLRDILDAHPDLVLTVEVGEHPPDVDTAADLDRLRAALHHR